MQMDNDIGKVALATPILICKNNPKIILKKIINCFLAKALEIFMQNLVDKISEKSKSLGANKLELFHLY